MLNSDDLYGPASEQLFTAQLKPSMMPESQHAHSVHAKQIQYSALYVYSQLFLDNTAWMSGMWQAAKWIALTFLRSDDTLPSNCTKRLLYLSETNLECWMKVSQGQAVDIK